jgi:hypothetical protein
MKVKDLKILLENLNPEAELGIDGMWNTPKIFVWNKVVEQSYNTKYKSFQDGTPQEIIIIAEKKLKECVARKNSNEYKDTVKQVENMKQVLPAYVLKYIK